MKPWNLNDYDAFFLDVDGVLVHDSQPIEGAMEAFRALQSAGQVLILTNNSTRSRQQHAERLSSLGFSVQSGDVVCSSFVVAEYLREAHGEVTVWPLGEIGLTDELLASGHRLAAEPGQAQWVVAGMDRAIDYAKLADGLRALNAGARLAATNLDGTYPTPEGQMPGAGAIVGALRGMGFDPEVNVGKPEKASYDIAIGMTKVARNRVLMIGDRLETDIHGGNQSDLDTLLVLTGISREPDIEKSGIHPTWISASLAAILTGKISSYTIVHNLR
ncbi:HAD-IIA family hydrolase [Candidatus Bipolaricaulota bacterium]|nr:HAD-IIA family hydrolase [Candidatus Bipolaricaulota bacterium]